MNTLLPAKHLIPLVFAAAICLLLTACDPVSSVRPLSSPDSAKADPQLVGTWRAKDNSEPSTIRISITKGGAWMHAEVSPGKTKKGEPESYDFFTTVIGHDHYLNVVMFNKDAHGHSAKRYVILRYEISWSHKLQMWLMDDDEVADAIGDGKLKGTVHENKDVMIGSPSRPDQDVTIKDSSANLAKFVHDTDTDDLFPDKLNTLYRVK